MNDGVVWKVKGTFPEIYEHFIPASIHAWASRLVSLAQPQPGQRVLDVACGTGLVTHLLAEHVGNAGQVVGYDISPDMIGVARAKKPNTSIAWQLGDACSLPFQDHAFDIVICQLGLMFFQDRVASLREMYRVLAPQGQLLVLVWGAIERNPGYLAVAEGFKRHMGEEFGAMIRGSFVLGDDEQMRSLAGAAGLPDAIVQAESAQAHFSSVEMLVHGYGAMMQPASDAATLVRLIADVTTTLQPYISNTGLTFPIEALLMRVIRM
ncbi:MAG: ubiquinone/menaquinone biosynthesis methyltransferase [Chloroflexota bacterium]|nr:MAG: ubiquinone/menaquinone biosynthesis methyltransferase [Chloroflexota bacterium]